MTSKPIRVLLLHRDMLFHGGVTNSYITFAEHRDPTTVDVVLGSLQPPSVDTRKIVENSRAQIITLTDSFPMAVVRLMRAVRSLQISCIVTGSFRSYMVSKVAVIGTSCRVIYRIPSIPFQKDPIRKNIFRLLARKDTLIFISQAVLKAHEYSWHRGETRVIYNGVADMPQESVLNQEQRERLRKGLGIPAEAKVIGYIAEFVDWKNHQTLLSAVDTLHAEVPNLHLLLVGTGESMPKVQEQCSAMRSPACVHFLGARKDVRELLQILDVYVHPADGEGFGRAIVEAMLAGRPVLAAQSGAIPELIENGRSGLLFPAQDSRILADRLKYLFAHPDIAKQLGTAARNRALNNYSPQDFASRMTALLVQEVCKE